LRWVHVQTIWERVRLELVLEVLLSFLEQLEDCFSVCEVNDIVFVTSLIPCDLLIWGVSPISIHSEFILVSLWVQELDEVVSRGLLPYFVLKRCRLKKTRALNRLTWDNFLHLFPLPLIELRTNLDIFSPERPLEDVLDFIQPVLLLLLLQGVSSHGHIR
jgi:hypothetical protein